MFARKEPSFKTGSAFATKMGPIWPVMACFVISVRRDACVSTRTDVSAVRKEPKEG